jgi:hypothetical protein
MQSVPVQSKRICNSTKENGNGRQNFFSRKKEFKELTDKEFNRLANSTDGSDLPTE